MARAVVAAAFAALAARDVSDARAGPEPRPTRWWSCDLVDDAETALRDASKAALARRWDDTREGLATAAEHLRVVAQSAPERFVSKVAPITVVLRDLQLRAASSNPVDARELRALADRVAGIRPACPAPARS